MDFLNSEIEVSVRKAKAKKKIVKITKLIVLFVLLFLLLAFIVMHFIYNNGNFSITLDKNLYFERGIIIYDDPDYKVYRSELFAAANMEFIDNMLQWWLPNDLDEHDGSHNGDNYIAYTFYVENTGTDTSDYWYMVLIDDVIRNVDDAIRIRIYRNGEPTTYAKIGADGNPEIGTTPFVNEELVTFYHREKFKPGDIDKYTIVVWVSGPDRECTDNILGGEIKMHMEFNSEFKEVDQSKYNTKEKYDVKDIKESNEKINEEINEIND